MHFPYERYEKLAEPFLVHYPAGEEALARWISQHIAKAADQLSHLLALPRLDLNIVLVARADWPSVPRNEAEKDSPPHPYWTDETSPASLIVPVAMDVIFGEITPAKFAFMLYHEVALAYLEADPRPWPDESPLWADEWQFKFAALWLSHTLDSQHGVVNTDLHVQHSDIFEQEADGKTPVTIRGFDWYEDTSSEDYLHYELLLEQFAADLLARYDVSILPRFLALYRTEQNLLSEDVTAMLIGALGPDSSEWLEELVYF